MNRLWKTAAVLLMFALMSICLTVSAFAASESEGNDFDYLDIRSFQTVLTDVNGESTTVDGILDLRTLSSFRGCEYLVSYDLYYCGALIMHVDLNDVTYEPNDRQDAGHVSAPNGWYAVEFSMDESLVCYLTGLTGRSLLQVENELITSKLENRYFSLSNVDFIDTEKNYVDDTMLCWAASTSDVLTYTGWAQLAGFTSVDDLFEAYITTFTDVGGSAQYGIEWFFNGLNRPQELGWSGWAVSEDYGVGFSGYLPAFDGYSLTEEFNTINQPLSNMDATFQHLRDGWGVSISIGWYRNGIRNGGHAITLWGYVEDRSQDGKERFPALIISDSDSDIWLGAERRDIENEYRLLMTDPYNDYDLDTFELDYSMNSKALLDGFVCLMPYSEDIETERTGTMNKFNAPDLVFNGLQTFFIDGSSQNVFSPRMPITVSPYFYNMSPIAMDAPFTFALEIYNEAGEHIDSEQGECHQVLSGFSSSYKANTDQLVVGPLPAGEYSFEITINPDNAVEEAYTVNNTTVIPISVRDPGVDVSGVLLTVSEPFFSDTTNRMETTITCEGLDTVSGEILDWKLCLSYLEDGKWSALEVADSGESLSAVSEWTCPFKNRGEKMKAVLLVLTTESESLFTGIESEPVALSYNALTIVPSENNSWNYSFEAGSNTFDEDQNLAFTVRNTSTSGNAIDYALYCYAQSNWGDDSFMFQLAETGHLDAGSSSDEYVFTSIDAQIDTSGMSGEYTLFIFAYGAWGYSDSIMLGVLTVENDKVILYSQSCNARDIFATFQAIAYLPFEPSSTGMRVSCKSDDNSLDYSLVLSNYSKVANNVYYFYSNNTWILPPDTTFNWRAHYTQDDVDYEFKTWDSFKTASLEQLSEPLTLGETVSGNFENNIGSFYCFTPEEDGYYVFSGISNSYAIIQFWNEDAKSWSSYFYAYSTTPSTMTLWLEADKTQYILVTGSSGFTIGVEGQTFPESLSVPELTLSVDPSSIQATVFTTAPYNANFSLYLDYGFTMDSLNEVCVGTYRNYTGVNVTATQSMNVMPGETLYVRARVVDMTTGVEYVGEWQTATAPMPPAIMMTIDQEQVLQLQAGDSTYLRFTTPTDGIYFIDFTGVNGQVELLLPDRTRTIVGDTIGDSVMATPILEGEMPYYLLLKSYAAGEYRITVKRHGVAQAGFYSSDFNATLELRAVVPDDYEDYILGVYVFDSLLLKQGTVNGKAIQQFVENRGDMTVSFTMDFCPGAEIAWYGYMINTITGEQYSTPLRYDDGEMAYAEHHEFEQVTGSGCFRYNPPKANLYYAWVYPLSGGDGVLLHWDPLNLSWEEYSFSEYPLFEAKEYQYFPNSAMGDYTVESGLRPEFFRLIQGDSSTVWFYILPMNSSVSVTTGEATAAAFSAEISFDAIIGYGTDVKVGIAYGSSRERMNYTWCEVPGPLTTSTTLSVTVDTLPETVYQYCAVMYDEQTARFTYGEWNSFTTPAAADGDCLPLELDKLTQKLGMGVYVFDAPADGIYTLTASGEEVAVSVCGGDGLWHHYSLEADKRSVSFEMSEGDVLYIRQKGESRLMMTNGFAYAEYDADNTAVSICLIPDVEAMYIVTAYGENGKQLDCKFLTPTDINRVMVELTAEEAVSYVKVFRLDESVYAPVVTATAIAAPEA